VNTDYNPEGISLPAQRESCEQKARSLGAEVVRDFVEPGRTATTIDKRPVFQEMLAWIKEKRDIDYVVVYHFNRIFRNSVDAGLTKRDLRKLGVRVVSTIIDLGEGPESDMVESILNAVDEYRSRADGADIAYKMGAKAKQGGTLGRARLGYLNARDLSEGRNIGIVKFDPERADLVRTAFELYATGDYSVDRLADELAKRGLRTRPGRFSAGPVSSSKVAVLLSDLYYIGYVTYKGQLIKGRHEALVSNDLFDRVQAVLNERRGRGERQRQHPHFLKGILWCGRCHNDGVESRMYMQWAKGNGGRYRYFFCGRKQHRQCESRYIEGDAIETAIFSFLRHHQLPNRPGHTVATNHP
jgi:DNA invertase Pin-like site-specific DNA recombinase